MLTDSQIRYAKPTDRPRKIFDERGLYLLVAAHRFAPCLPAQAFGASLAIERSRAPRGACSPALRRLPGRDSHPLKQCSMNPPARRLPHRHSGASKCFVYRFFVTSGGSAKRLRTRLPSSPSSSNLSAVQSISRVWMRRQSLTNRPASSRFAQMQKAAAVEVQALPLCGAPVHDHIERSIERLAAHRVAHQRLQPVTLEPHPAATDVDREDDHGPNSDRCSQCKPSRPPGARELTSSIAIR